MSTTEPKHPSTELDEERVRALIDSLTHLSPASQHLIEVMKGPDQF